MKAITILVAASALTLGTTAMAQTTGEGTARLTGQERAAQARAEAAARKAEAAARKAERTRNPNAATPAIPATRADPATGMPATRATPAVPAHRATGDTSAATRGNANRKAP